jgi:transglutaminase-like putative cysteine protease
MSHAAREARAAGMDFAAWDASAPAADLAAAPPRISGRFYLSALVAMPPVLIAVAMLFIIMPRTSATGALAPAILRMGQQPTSGFSSTVRLGAVGQIQQDPTPVMHVTVRDPKTGESLQVSSLLLRGLPLDAYVQEDEVWSWQLTSRRAGRWYWESSAQSPRFDFIYEGSFPGYNEAPHREITCDISIEPLDTPLLFAPFAPESVSAPKRFSVGVNARTYVLENGIPYRRTPLSYTVTSRLYDAAPPPTPPTHTLPEQFLRPFLALPSELSPKIRALAQEIAPASVRTDYEKAQRILDYLSDSTRFSYTTDMQPTAGVEPVEDFLFNLKRGHCEYFASSMVVLLREVNVPARLVNGFKVSEWNPISEAYIVRQQHAHSWVEAYLRPYGWRTLDPTAASRDAATPTPMLARRIGTNIYDWIDSLWVAYVLNFDSFSQASPYNWLRRMALNVEQWTTGGPLKHIAIGLGPSRLQPSDVSSPFDAVLVGIRWTVVALLGVGLVWVIAQGVRAWRQPGRREPRQFKFYIRMERLLRRRGFRRAGAQTPWEFSAALAQRQWPAAAEVAAITERFCLVRYGARPLTEADLGRIEQALQAIRRTR